MVNKSMKILITGANGFIGKNLHVRLNEFKQHEIYTFGRGQSISELEELINQVDWVFHLAGINRPKDPNEFKIGNADLTDSLCLLIAKSQQVIPVVLSSSIQSNLENDYGKSKLAAETSLLNLNKQTANPVFIYRLPNVFGKWSRPNYNSAVATFCHNIARDLPITINNADASINLVYIDDILDAWITLLNSDLSNLSNYQQVIPEYTTTVGNIATTINAFKESIQSGITLPVGTGLTRALYSTYLSFLPTQNFAYPLIKHEDPRGVFVEMLKTPDSGQFSFFTAHPGITRGGHYHHTKTEKFLVIKGTAKYRFRHIVTDEYYELIVDGTNPTIVETIPGWSHDVTNIGNDELVVMLWANEIFDRQKPDTINFTI